MMKLVWRYISSALAAYSFLGVAMTTVSHADDWEHFACYRIDPHGAARLPTVELKDQFSHYKAAVLRPVSLCNPVDKNGEGIKDASRHLICYEIEAKPTGKAPSTVDVITANQFTEQSMTAVLPPTTLCVPSKKEIL